MLRAPIQVLDADHDLAGGIAAAERAMREGTERHQLEGNDDATRRALLEPFGCSVEAHDPWLADDVLAGVTGENAGILGRRELGLDARGGVVVAEIGRLVVADVEVLLAGLPPVACKHGERPTVGRLCIRPIVPAALGS